VLAYSGTVATIVLSLQLATVAGTLFKLTVLGSCISPKLKPTIVTTVLTGPIFFLIKDRSGPDYLVYK